MAETTEGMNATGVLITCSEDAEAYAQAELEEMFPTDLTVTWIRGLTAEPTGIALVQAGVSFDAFADTIASSAPIFIRHIAPVQRTISLQRVEADREALAVAASELAHHLDPQKTYSVQSRLLDETQSPYSRSALNHILSDVIAPHNEAPLDARQPEQVVSVLCTPTDGYLGISRTEQNGSAWPGGNHRFRREEGQVSRAEFKLMEALSVFNITLPERGTALDIGAAPGGWTRVLRQHGMKVVAVDPADLDSRLSGDTGITHIRERIQPYLPSAGRFEVIVNDLKMDAPASVAILLQAAPHLKHGGLALMTLKLPQSIRPAQRMLSLIREDVHRLSKAYHVLGVRQLFHNRSEVTVALRAG